MTEAAAPAPAAAQPQTPAPVLPPPPDVQAPPAPKPGDAGTPEWLNPRLEQAKRSARAELLKEIGVDDPALARKALDESKARADAEKTASELLAAEKKARERAETDAKTYRDALAVRAEAELAQLTPAQRSFVEKQAGADPAKRLAAVEDVRALVASAPPPAPPPPVAAAEKRAEEPPKPAPAVEKKILPAPASTAAGGAPPGGQPPAPVDHLAVLARLDATNPYAAGRYFDKHRAEITRLRAQKTAAPASQ